MKKNPQGIVIVTDTCLLYFYFVAFILTPKPKVDDVPEVQWSDNNGFNENVVKTVQRACVSHGVTKVSFMNLKPKKKSLTALKVQVRG